MKTESNNSSDIDAAGFCYFKKCLLLQDRIKTESLNAIMSLLVLSFSIEDFSYQLR
jgi:hypothetical protein